MPQPGFSTKLTFFLGGLLIWAAHFLFVYGLNGLACARGFDRNTVVGIGLIPMIILAATLVAVIASGGVLVAAVLGRGPGIWGEAHRPVRDFWRFGTAVLAAFSMVAVIWTGLPALMIRPCA